MDFIDLSRRFFEITRRELQDSDVLAATAEYDSGYGTITWAELLQHPRIVLLAEGGSGKTAEMRHRTTQLQQQNQPAFFVPLEALDREDVTQSMSANEEKRFREWKEHDHSKAWFFLDAVDELKLVHGKLERALLRLSKNIDGLLHRTNVMISCRPSDWRDSLDLTTFERLLPIAPVESSRSAASEEVFLRSLRRSRHSPVLKQGSSVTGVRVVVLAPLTPSQITQFANRSGARETYAFIEEIDRHSAWAFARRPLDLVELIEIWNAHRHLGTRSEQHENNIAVRLKDDPDRPDHGVLIDERARLGAESLALALSLTQARTILSPNVFSQKANEGVLDPAAILTGWTEQERQTLVRRALFDPATYGRVRFHHRSVQEFLSAKRLDELRRKGMPAKALIRLLFSDRYEEPVIRPSMRPLAAWLALWHDDIRREVILREPEILLSAGDPEALALAGRAELLRAFVKKYKHGGWRGVSVANDEVQRFAHPDLAEVIRELWESDSTNPDVKSLLLSLIQFGKIEQCADIAQSVAYSTDATDDARITAVTALVACGCVGPLQDIAEAMKDKPELWPPRIIGAVIDELFPNPVSPQNLVAYIERTDALKQAGSPFPWALQQIASKMDEWSSTSIELRDLLEELIWNTRVNDTHWYRPASKFSALAPGLALLCNRQLLRSSRVPDDRLIRAAVVAYRFRGEAAPDRQVFSDLQKRFEVDLALRARVFWPDLDIMERLTPTDNDQARLHRTLHDSLLTSLQETDIPWFIAALRNSAATLHRTVALHAILRFWLQGRLSDSEQVGVRETIRNDKELSAVLQLATSAPASSSTETKWDRDQRRRRLVSEGREKQRLEKWVEWRSRIIADPEGFFEGAALPGTIRTLYSWLEVTVKPNGYNAWDSKALHEAFGASVAELALRAFSHQWRTEVPVPWSHRPEAERNSTPYTWIYGLCGLGAESSSSGWTERLNEHDVKLAAVYATIELNAFPAWLPELVKTHPSAVETTIGDELDRELQMAADQYYLPVLQKVAYGDERVKHLFADRLLIAVENWPRSFDTIKSATNSEHNLKLVLSVLREVYTEPQAKTISTECESRIVDEFTSPLALTWLFTLFQFEPERAIAILQDGIINISYSERESRAVNILASLFGDRGGVLLDIKDTKLKAQILDALVRFAYTFVKPSDDQQHQGVHSPDVRDRAQTARNFLLSALLDTSGSEARRVLLRLADDPMFSHIQDRLRHLARERAAKDTESAPLEPKDVLSLEQQYEFPTYSRDSLYQMMIDRLDDLQHEVAHHDFSDRRTLRTINAETEMQRTIALRLSRMARNMYLVAREEEVADLKKTDIRLLAIRGGQKATVEVKIADSWTLSELRRALTAQLVGQYLRHEDCRAGCLLLVYRGEKRYWQNGRTQRLYFDDVVKGLIEQARQIEQIMGYSIRLTVYGLDLCDPKLASAH